MANKSVIFDLDGTLADIRDRRTLATKDSGKIDWPKFFDPQNIALDKPNSAVIESFKALQQAGFRMVIFSGRSEATREETEKWLESFGIKADLLLMRPATGGGMFIPDDILKEAWLREQFPNKNNILCVYDDRDKVVAMWRRNGIPCFQVAPGDF
jgi:hypothetical protein